MIAVAGNSRRKVCNANSSSTLALGATPSSPSNSGSASRQHSQGASPRWDDCVPGKVDTGGKCFQRNGSSGSSGLVDPLAKGSSHESLGLGQQQVRSLADLNSKSKLKDLSMRRRCFMFMEEPSLHPIALWIFYFYSGLIVFSVFTTIAHTMDTWGHGWADALNIAEIFFNTLFTAEVLLRIFCAPRLIGVLRRMYTCIDIFAVLPFFIVTVPDMDKDSNPILELLLLVVPVFRLLKVTRYSSGWRLLMHSIQQVLKPLLVPFLLLMIMVITFSCFIFWLEKHCTQNMDERAFETVPHAMWFALVTISTVGYGDVTPKTPEARLLTCCMIITGVCYMAMPLAIVGTTFGEVWENRDRVLMRMKVKEKLDQVEMDRRQLEELFGASDEDGSGSMTRSEFMSLLEALNLGMTPQQSTRLFKTIDDNGSGEINFQEFADFLFPEIEIDHSQPYQVNVDNVDGDDAGQLVDMTPQTTPQVARGSDDAGDPLSESRAHQTVVPLQTAASPSESLQMAQRLENFDKRMESLEKAMGTLSQQVQSVLPVIMDVAAATRGAATVEVVGAQEADHQQQQRQ
mmetsp:Transcript_124362/g.277853  ORF Transcript_124362/g.277853 Transcript_124362/m.277853 type:complete len:572 (+) Transcript_124362:98-1813(+)